MLVTDRSDDEAFVIDRRPVMVGVTSVAVVIVGDVPKTKAPVPVSSVTIESSSADVSIDRDDR